MNDFTLLAQAVGMGHGCPACGFAAALEEFTFVASARTGDALRRWFVEDEAGFSWPVFACPQCDTLCHIDNGHLSVGRMSDPCAS